MQCMSFKISTVIFNYFNLCYLKVMAQEDRGEAQRS